jgi:DNA-binding transcriptional LysR family regulator
MDEGPSLPEADMSRDLNDTLIFIKVVEHGSFTAAAQVLQLPRTTVSRKVQDLEDRLGARLLNRTTRKLALSEAGTVYYEHARQIADELDAAEEAVQQLEGKPRGWLRVTAPYAFGVAVLGPMLLEFRKRYPAIHLDLVLSNDRLDLVTDEIDVAVRFGNLADSSMVARRLATYPTRVYASSSYIAQHGEPSHPDELSRHRTVVNAHQRRGRRFVWPLKNGADEGEFEVRPVFVANDPWPVLAMLSSGEGLMLATPAMVMCCEEAMESVLPVLEGWTGPDVDLNAVFLGGRVLSPKVRAFVDFLVERRVELAVETDAASGTAARRDAWPVGA